MLRTARRAVQTHKASVPLDPGTLMKSTTCSRSSCSAAAPFWWQACSISVGNVN